MEGHPPGWPRLPKGEAVRREARTNRPPKPQPSKNGHMGQDFILPHVVSGIKQILLPNLQKLLERSLEAPLNGAGILSSFESADDGFGADKSAVHRK